MNGKRSCQTRVSERESKMQRRDRERRCCALLAFGKKYGNRKTSFFRATLMGSKHIHTDVKNAHTQARSQEF